MRLMVLGGTRYAGRSLLENCAEYPAFTEVQVASRRQVEMNGVSSVVVDRKDEDSLRSAIFAYAPDVIIDMICYDGADAATMARLENDGTLRSVRHYLVVSTFFLNLHNALEFGISASSDQAAIAEIQEGYTRRKAEMELQLAYSPLHDRSTILRLPFIFSRDDYTNRFQTFCHLARRNPVESFATGPRFSMIEKTDTAAAILSLASQPPRGLCAACNPGSVSSRELAHFIVEAAGTLPGNHEMAEMPYAVTRDVEMVCPPGISLRSLRSAVMEEARHVG